MTSSFQVENPEVKATLNDISGRINGVLPINWGFLLMLFDFGDQAGQTFYASSGERESMIALLKDWLQRQPVPGEVNPDHAVTSAMRDNWHKIVAVLLSKLTADGRVLITADDVQRLTSLSVAVDSRDDGMHVYLVDTEEARRLAAEGRAVEAK